MNNTAKTKDAGCPEGFCTLPEAGRVLPHYARNARIRLSEAARVIGVSPRTMCFWTKGHRELPTDAAFKLMRLLDIPADHLFATGHIEAGVRHCLSESRAALDALARLTPQSLYCAAEEVEAAKQAMSKLSDRILGKDFRKDLDANLRAIHERAPRDGISLAEAWLPGKKDLALPRDVSYAFKRHGDTLAHWCRRTGFKYEQVRSALLSRWRRRSPAFEILAALKPALADLGETNLAYRL